MYNDVYINKFLKYLHNIPSRLIVQTIKIKFVLLKKMCFIEKDLSKTILNCIVVGINS